MTEENKDKKEEVSSVAKKAMDDKSTEAKPVDNAADKSAVAEQAMSDKPVEVAEKEEPKVEEMGSLPSNFKIAIGKKIGMTQLFDEEGNMNSATIIRTASCKVVYTREIKTDGYSAVCLGFEDLPERKLNKAMKGAFKKYNTSAVRHLKEFRVPSTDGVKSGQPVVLTEGFKEGEFINVQGVSKGKGFAGTMKRHNFSGTTAGHGSSYTERKPGSISSRRSLGRVVPGQRMCGHMGVEAVTMEKVKVLKIDSSESLIYLNCSVPGAMGSIVYLVETTKAQPKPKVKAKGKKK
ncbi:MAG: 50S ribosomal protein L3 [Elusimicrobiota bacterium]|nr:50S ribosomal protein L3 [Elusimicrobiota bacterium]